MHLVLSEYSVILLCFVQAKALCRCGCMYFFVGGLGGGKSAVYMLNIVGDRTPPWGTPVQN